MTSKADDLEAVRIVADTLQSFTSDDGERIIRWAREGSWLQERKRARSRGPLPSKTRPSRCRRCATASNAA